MKYQIVLKNIVAGIWALLAATIAAVVVWIHIECRNSVSGSDAAWVYSVIGLYFIAPLCLLSYGLFKSRRWVLTWHSILVCIFLFFGTLATITAGRDLLRQRDSSTALFFLLVWIFPLLTQFFLFKIRNTVLFKAPQPKVLRAVTLWISGGIALIPVIAGGVMLVILMIMLGPAKDRIEHQTIENGRYRISVYHLPSSDPLSGDYTKVVMVDKNSLLKGEKELFFTRGSKDYRLEFVDSTTVRIPGSAYADTLIFDLTDPGGETMDITEWPLFREKLDYPGCEDKIIAENDGYAVTLRTYPHSGRNGTALVRLLFREKSAWYPVEEILFETHPGDSVEAVFVASDSLDVTVYLEDDRHRQTGKYGQVVRHTFDLRNPGGPPDDLNPFSALSRNLQL